MIDFCLSSVNRLLGLLLQQVALFHLDYCHVGHVFIVCVRVWIIVADFAFVWGLCGCVYGCTAFQMPGVVGHHLRSTFYCLSLWDLDIAEIFVHTFVSGDKYWQLYCLFLSICITITILFRKKRQERETLNFEIIQDFTLPPSLCTMIWLFVCACSLFLWFFYL